MTAMVGLGTSVGDTDLHTTILIYSHVVMFAFVLAGLRHVFSMPIELRANWIFRLTEASGEIRSVAPVGAQGPGFGGADAVSGLLGHFDHGGFPSPGLGKSVIRSRFNLPIGSSLQFECGL